MFDKNESDENVESVQLFRLAALVLLTLERREVELTSNQQPGVNSAEVQQQYNAMQGLLHAFTTPL